MSGQLQVLQSDDIGLLVQHGQQGGAVYTLAESLAPAAAQRLSRTALEKLVLEEAGRHPVRNADIREVTGLDRTEARSLLARMVADDRLRQRGVTRGTVYIRGRR